MPTPVALPGFEGRPVLVQSSPWSGKVQLFADGVEVMPTTQTGTTYAPISTPGPAAKGQRNEFLLRQNDGSEVLVRVKPGFPDPAPVLELNGQTIRTARALSPFEWIWAAFPLVLIILGGAIGGAMGAGAAVVNINLIRDESKGPLRYVMCAVVTTFTIFLWAIVVALLRGVIRR